MNSAYSDWEATDEDPEVFIHSERGINGAEFPL